MLSHQLEPGVRAVCANGRLVFLDVGRDRYLKLDRRRTEIVQGEFARAGCEASDERLRLLKRLTSAGIVRADKAPLAESLNVCPMWVDALLTWRACAWAGQRLHRSFAEIVHEVSAWRGVHSKPVSAAGFAQCFQHFRPFYPRDYACLFDALALMRFLYLRGVSGYWVFGVRSAPFAAHCWVEDAMGPINDDVDVTGAYTEIMRL